MRYFTKTLLSVDSSSGVTGNTSAHDAGSLDDALKAARVILSEVHKVFFLGMPNSVVSQRSVLSKRQGPRAHADLFAVYAARATPTWILPFPPPRSPPPFPPQCVYRNPPRYDMDLPAWKRLLTFVQCVHAPLLKTSSSNVLTTTTTTSNAWTTHAAC